MTQFKKVAFAWLSLTLPAFAMAGMSTTASFLQPEDYSLGIEPELILTDGAGIGMNARFTYGVNALSNATAILGTGSGPRQFRVGGVFTFDFFPDVDKQPGIGLALTGMYYRLRQGTQKNSTGTVGSLELSAMPYVHKAFEIREGVMIDPFIGVPIGAAFSDGVYQGIASIAGGATVKPPGQFSYTLEIGVAVANQDSYIAGSASYSP